MKLIISHSGKRVEVVFPQMEPNTLKLSEVKGRVAREFNVDPASIKLLHSGIILKDSKSKSGRTMQDFGIKDGDFLMLIGHKVLPQSSSRMPKVDQSSTANNAMRRDEVELIQKRQQDLVRLQGLQNKINAERQKYRQVALDYLLQFESKVYQAISLDSRKSRQYELIIESRPIEVDSEGGDSGQQIPYSDLDKSHKFINELLMRILISLDGVSIPMVEDLQIDDAEQSIDQLRQSRRSVVAQIYALLHHIDALKDLIKVDQP
ncbi:hypothetical protein MIR68_000586 [Amoeboaphelidium protococcarum]|nr:hypothetical protein MIR68_000586 [Amoeboaphelidium protococcarum]